MPFAGLWAEITLEDLMQVGALFLLWMPIAVLSFCGCLCGAELTLQQCPVAKKHLTLTAVITIAIMTVMEAASWMHFVFWPCYRTFGMPLLLITVGFSILIYAIMIRIMVVMIRKHDSKGKT